MAGSRLLDVRRDQRRHGSAGRALRLDDQSQFPRPSGAGIAHPPDESGDGGGGGGDRAHRRRTPAGGGSMKPFTTLTAPAVPLRLANVDTDQLLPGRFLRKPRSDGYDNYLFHDIRRAPDGALRQDFPLNDPRWAGAPILVADRNFGGGS